MDIDGVCQIDNLPVGNEHKPENDKDFIFMICSVFRSKLNMFGYISCTMTLLAMLQHITCLDCLTRQWGMDTHNELSHQCVIVRTLVSLLKWLTKARLELISHIRLRCFELACISNWLWSGAISTYPSAHLRLPAYQHHHRSISYLHPTDPMVTSQKDCGIIQNDHDTVRGRGNYIQELSHPTSFIHLVKLHKLSNQHQVLHGRSSLHFGILLNAFIAERVRDEKKDDRNYTCNAISVWQTSVWLPAKPVYCASCNRSS